MAVPGTLDAGIEWHAYRMTIANTNTVGAGACAGCTTPVCLVQNSIKAASIGGASELCVAGTEANAGWQCAMTFTHACLASSGNCVTPTRNPTWGQIKSLWR